MLKIKNKKSTREGFSMVEVLIATLIFSVGFVSVANLMLGSLKSSADSRNGIIAAQLAQEGVELVRNFRDNNIAFGSVAFDGINTIGDMICPQIGASVNDADFVTCPVFMGYEVGQLFYGNTGYSYGRGGAGTDPVTPFLRKVTVVPEGIMGDKYMVRSMVIWGDSLFTNFEDANIGNCNSINKCTYVELILNDTGWK